MKLIIVGSTGFVATEVIRQSLSNPSITSIYALARRTTPIPSDLNPGADTKKLVSVICEDFLNYGDEVKRELDDADACIWLLAVTPSQARKMPWEQVKKTCHDYTIYGLETLAQLPRDGSMGKPLRFLYTSGSNTVKEESQKAWVLGDYLLMRGQTESQVLIYAKSSNGKVEACIAKPGMILTSGNTNLIIKIAKLVVGVLVGVPNVEVEQIAASLIDAAVKGVKKDELWNDEMVRIGGDILAGKQSREVLTTDR